MIKRIDFKSRLKISLSALLGDTKSHLKNIDIYETLYNFMIIFGFIICLFAAAYYMSLGYVIITIFLIILLPTILIVGFGFEEEWKLFIVINVLYYKIK